LIARRGDKPPPVAPATVVHVELTVTPREAEIVLDGVPVGRGTLTRDVPITGEPHTLRLSAPGYEAQSLGFQAAPPPASITLTPARPGQRPKE
jgi:hypothetical protein